MSGDFITKLKHEVSKGDDICHLLRDVYNCVPKGEKGGIELFLCGSNHSGDAVHGEEIDNTKEFHDGRDGDELDEGGDKGVKKLVLEFSTKSSQTEHGGG